MNEVETKVDAISESRRATPQPTKPNKKNTRNNVILAAIVILALAYLGRNDIANIADIDFFPEDTPDVVIAPADVGLYKFSDPYDNNSVNVEFWLRNIGEMTATEIEVYVRVRNHNGTILFSEIVDTTTLLLRDNENCSGTYFVEYGDAEYLTHTVELSWDGGRHSYQKTTTIA